MNENKIHMATALLLEALGINLNDPNFNDTPERVARMYKEICSGLEDLDNKIDQLFKASFPTSGYDEIISCTGIEVFSLCPHHLLPVRYSVSVGYIPSSTGLVIGASKLPRLVKLLAKRPVLQEQLTDDIAKYLNKLHTDGVAVVVHGQHLCMQMRGVEQTNSVFRTSKMTGCFRDNPATREEFMDLIQL